jgi:hypothetical protein
MADAAAVEHDDWEGLMATYLRRKWRQHRLKLLDAPAEVISADEIFRKSWVELEAALKADFGARLTDPQTVEFLQHRFEEIASQVGFAETTLKAQDAAAPCESCEFRSEPDERDTDQISEKMPLSEILRRRCSATPQLISAAKTCGRWTHGVEECSTFEVKRFLAVEYEESNESIRARNQSDLETATTQLEVWIGDLNLSEQLLD